MKGMRKKERKCEGKNSRIAERKKKKRKKMIRGKGRDDKNK